MKALPVLSILICLLTMPVLRAETTADENTTYYKAKAFGSMATGSYTPFWIVSNKYGMVPVDANNGYFNAGVFHQQQVTSAFRWSAGLDLVAVAPRNHNVYIQQLYAEVGYRCLQLSIGAKENKHSLWDLNLSSGDMVLSTNGRPIPEVNISIPVFTTIPGTNGWLRVKGDFAIGKSFDKNWIRHIANGKQVYNENPLWHHKSVYAQVKSAHTNFPLSAIVGLQHWAQFGGTSTDPELGNQFHSVKDLFRALFGLSGGANSTISDQINVYGNHFGAYDFKLSYTKPKWNASVYYQHIFNDNSGMEFFNSTDGLWGGELAFNDFPWMKKVVLEYITTRHQSGPFHYIWYDHDKYHGPGGGYDNYYNNNEYKTGASYYGRAVGSPLLTSPEYNENGDVDFKNNRIRAWHFGFEGHLSQQVFYRIKYSHSMNWGTYKIPFFEKKHNNSAVIEITYRHPKLTGWEFGGAVAGDYGKLYGDNTGFSLSVSKKGILKNWNK